MRAVGRVAGLAAAALAGGLLPTVLANALSFWWAGALQPYLDATLRANVAYLEVPVAFGTILMRIRYGPVADGRVADLAARVVVSGAATTAGRTAAPD